MKILFYFLLASTGIVFADTSPTVEIHTSVLAGFIEKDVLAEAKAKVLYEQACERWKTKVASDTSHDLDILNLSCGPLAREVSDRAPGHSGFVIKFDGTIRAAYKFSPRRYLFASEEINGTSRHNRTERQYSLPDYRYDYEVQRKCHERAEFLKKTLKDKLVYADCLNITQSGTTLDYLRTTTGEQLQGLLEQHLTIQLQLLLSSGSNDKEIQTTEGNWEGDRVQGNLLSPYSAPWDNVNALIENRYQAHLPLCNAAEQKFKDFFGADFIYMSCKRFLPHFDYVTNGSDYDGHRYHDSYYIKDDIMQVKVGGEVKAYYLVTLPKTAIPPASLVPAVSNPTPANTPPSAATPMPVVPVSTPLKATAVPTVISPPPPKAVPKRRTTVDDFSDDSVR